MSFERYCIGHKSKDDIGNGYEFDPAGNDIVVRMALPKFQWE